MQLNRKRSFTQAQPWVRLRAHGKESFGTYVRGSLTAGLGGISLCWHSSLPSPPACAGPPLWQHNPPACQPLLPKMIQVPESSVPSSRSLMSRMLELMSTHFTSDWPTAFFLCHWSQPPEQLLGWFWVHFIVQSYSLYIISFLMRMLSKTAKDSLKTG